MTQIGERVGAVMSSNATQVVMAGYGVYVGDVPCPHLGGRRNPKIKLDSGKQVWGCQCWWGPESAVVASNGKRTVVQEPDLEDWQDTASSYPTSSYPTGTAENTLRTIAIGMCGMDAAGYTPEMSAAAWEKLDDEERDIAVSLCGWLQRKASTP